MSFDSHSDALRVLALEPHLSLSHRVFLEGYQRYSRHQVAVWSLPGRAWKWRMRTAAYHFAERAGSLAEDALPDCILASDYLNVAEWRAFTRPRLDRTPVVLYVHENQATYPVEDGTPRDEHFGWINLSSMQAADEILFNSRYHRDDFFCAAAKAVRRAPPPLPVGLVEELSRRAQVFPVGIDFAPHERVLQEQCAGAPEVTNEPPVILWNHRWEYDKGPERFVEALIELRKRGVRFGLVLCGQRGGTEHPSARRLREELADVIVQDGFRADPNDYLRSLARADVVVSTARHEFFGVAVAEAIFMGCVPFLPQALSYPELVPPSLHETFLYDPCAPLDKALERFLRSVPREHHKELRAHVDRFDWRTLAPRLDTVLERAARNPP